MAKGFDAWAKSLNLVGDDLKAKGLVEIQTAVGLAAKESIVDAVVRTPAADGSLADGQMSGWPRAIVGKYDVAGTELAITPLKRSHGPMRVLEDGRKAYNAGDFRVRSIGKARTGKIGAGFSTVKSVQVNGRVGATKGKRTWSNAVRDIKAEHADVAERALQKFLFRYLGR